MYKYLLMSVRRVSKILDRIREILNMVIFCLQRSERCHQQENGTIYRVSCHLSYTVIMIYALIHVKRRAIDKSATTHYEEHVSLQCKNG